MRKENRIRSALAKGQVSIGTWLNLASPMAAEMLASCGFDWLCVDAEHSPMGLAEITEMIRAIESRGATPIVRVPNDRYDTLGRVLDAGAFGVVVPHVSTPEQAQRIAQACRFPPRGKRSMGSGRICSWGLDYFEWFNDEVVVIAMMEDRVGVENAQAIMSVDGIDIGFMGPTDLSLDLGAKFGSPEHEAAIQKILAACQKAHKPCGIPVGTGKAIKKRKVEGFVFFDLSADMDFLETEARRRLEEART